MHGRGLQSVRERRQDGEEAEMNKYYFDYEGRSESTECEKCAVESPCTPCEACRKYREAKSRDRQAKRAR